MAAKQPGDSIRAIFDPEAFRARFVVTMAMARNDVDWAIRRAVEAGGNGDPALSYLVRLATGHLFEGMDSLNAYVSESEEVRTLIRQVPKTVRSELKTVRGLRHQLGAGTLDHIRHNTFHYPSPAHETSDQQLASVLRQMGDRRAEVFVDFESRESRFVLRRRCRAGRGDEPVD